MKEMYYIYNNEAIASACILLVLQKTNVIDVAKLCLVLPFLLDDRTVSLLQKEEYRQMTLKDLIDKKSRIFSTFNNRYLALLPVFINAMIILYINGYILFDKGLVRLSSTSINIENYGDRLLKIKKVANTFVDLIINKNTPELYRSLNIQL
jgi:hypothetical protein